MRLRRLFLLCLFGTALFSLQVVAQNNEIEIIPIAHNLNNPRGVAIMPDGQLLVVEAGTGSDSPAEVVGSGRILQLNDLNADGDFDDEDERSVRLDAQPSFNSLAVYRTGHDEPFGLSDIYVTDEEIIYYTLDHPFAVPGPAGGEYGYYGEVGIYTPNTVREGGTLVIDSSATLNSFAFDPLNNTFYITESGYNRIMQADFEGNTEVIVEFPELAHGQQAVPSGIALDPTTGDLLVTLFSGFVHDYLGTDIGFMPGDSKVMRFSPDTGELSDEVTGLTTAIDVAVSDDGTVFIVELTTTWEPNPMPFDYDLFDTTLPPDPGGYARYTGRLTMYPLDGEPVILADGLDAPSNVTYHEGAIYLSTGLGTPGRQALSHRGIHEIEGIIYRITGF